MKCQICNKEIKNLRAHLVQVHKNELNTKEYYDKYVKENNEGICELCGNEASFEGLNHGYTKHCSHCKTRLKEEHQIRKLKSIEYKCRICGKKCSGLGGLNSHLKHHKMSSQEYYDKYFKKKEESRCKSCGVPTRFIGIVKGYTECCNSCKGKKVSETKKNWTIERKNEFIKKLKGNTHSNPEKAKKTKQERYSNENYVNVEQGMKTKRLKYNTISVNTWKGRYKNKRRFEKENSCTSLSLLTKEFGQGWQSLNLPKIYQSKQNVYIDNKYIPLIIEYTNTNHKTSSSKAEKSIVTYLKKFYEKEIIENSRQIINPLELDIYLPDIKLAIEYNGNRWHSIERGTPKDYHLNKSLLCRELDIRLIHIYEFEDLEKQKQLLKDYILGVDNYAKNDFNKNNLMNNIPKPEIIYDNNYTIYGAGKLY